MSALSRAIANDQHAVPCTSCARPTIVPGGLCVRCWPPAPARCQGRCGAKGRAGERCADPEACARG